MRPIIVGGGVAGSAAAIGLAAAGVSALVLERSRVTGDAICGGFLSWQSLAALERLGVTREALGGPAVRKLRLVAGPRVIEAQLPQAGMGLSRCRLDTLLLDRAMACGADVRRGAAVRSVETGAVVTTEGDRFASQDIFLATGKHGLAGHPRPAPRHVEADPVLGLRLRLAGTPDRTGAIGDAVELFVFDGGYCGLVLQEDGTANLCLAVRKSQFKKARGRPEQLLAHWAETNRLFADRLGNARGVDGKTFDAIGNIPYGWRAVDGAARLWKLGDQAAVIPSLAGEGMGIALASAESAVLAWQRGAPARDWQRGFAARARSSLRWAAVAWRAAESPRLGRTALGLFSAAPGLVSLLARLTRVSPEPSLPT
jgi:flavin-dependent dehydrogenase